jgi:phospholipase A1
MGYPLLIYRNKFTATSSIGGGEITFFSLTKRYGRKHPFSSPIRLTEDLGQTPQLCLSLPLEPVYMLKKILPVIFFLAAHSPTILAQYTTKATSDSLFRRMPLFSTYKDNYFSGGTTLDARPSKYNSDVKYQVSIRDILWRDITPAHLIPFITYSQLSFWNILLPSSPFGDNNYNPSIGVAKRLFTHDRLLGIATVVVEHESNGRDSIFSRSWNRVSFSFQGPISNRATIRVAAWIPFLYTDGNPDILQYYGYGEAALNYILLPDRLLVDVTVRKGDRWDWRGYAQTQLEYSPWRRFNGYFLLQWFQGYGEDLLNYNVKTSMLRIGLVLKSDHLTFP